MNNDGEPVFAEEDLPPDGADHRPARAVTATARRSTSASTARRTPSSGKGKGGKDVELDIPQGSGTPGQSKTNTYAGKDGVGVGNIFRKLLYAVHFGDANIMLSSRVNENSKILYDRSPRERVQKVAPWLTVDSDALPSVVDGKIVWLLDGYTTSDKYPLAEKKSLQEMTSDAINPRSAYATLPTDNINYMRNAVKATVDAYDGTVTLYEWDTSDPILKTWEKAFPGVVKKKADIPEDLLQHMRYPEDLFKVQRDMLGVLPRAGPEELLRGQRQVGRAGGPVLLDPQAAAVPPLGGHQERRGARLLADQRVRARRRSRTSRRSCRSAPTRPSRTATASSRSSGCPTPTRCPARRRSRTSSATTRRSPTSCARSSRPTPRSPTATC